MATGRLLCVGATDAATDFAASVADGEVETVPTTAAREYFETDERAACTTVFHDPPVAAATVADPETAPTSVDDASELADSERVVDD